MQNELTKKTFNEAGKTGDVEYKLRGMKINDAIFPDVQLTSVENVGMQGMFKGITLEGSGNVWYKYKKGWFKFSDDIDLSTTISGVDISLIVSVGVSAAGRPEIELRKCTSNVDSVDVDFHGGGAVKRWIYNLFRGLIGRKMKSKLNKMLCELVRKEIEGRARKELATFPVTKNIDRWALIDYRLTSAPTFRSKYMDIFFKGEFKSVSKPKESELDVQSFKIASDHSKMIYFWLSEYTVNTAGEVYQGSGILDVKIEAWDKKLPDDIRNKLYTSMFAIAIPNLSKYDNLPMSIRFVSHQPPMIIMNKESIHLFIFADATFGLKKKNGQEMEAFVLRFEIDTELSANVANGRITGKITKFNYKANVIKSFIGKIDLTMGPVIKFIIEKAVISSANPKLQKGFPLPKLDGVVFQNLDIQLHKNAIRIGTDVDYQREL